MKLRSLTSSDSSILGMNSTTPFPVRTAVSSSFIPPSPLDVTQDKLTNDLSAMRQNLKSTCSIWDAVAQLCPDMTAVRDDYHCDSPVHYTFSEVNSLVTSLSLHFHNFGLRPTSKASLFAENSAHWLLCDHAVQSLSATTAVRGADAPEDELRYIYLHSDSEIAILQGPSLLVKLSISATQSSIPGPCGLTSKSGAPPSVIVLINKEKKTEKDIEDIKGEHEELKDVEIVFLSDLMSTP
eukprot:CAMPEP_0118654588 /NCGR_PEP_ID=MMETSP0785-20121206/12473_1 /TAXON_ID=91992 /ORGANISM="Bolidomonas pacifica, Strain CCMP 1866" /LENGTH=238 /DNA_ID=CAMNT_0006547265 /DNA_START=159 /DNA_END=871 /DNA_ORIENTATION=+